MFIIKIFFKKLMSIFGFSIVKTSRKVVGFELFKNLANGYEQLLCEMKEYKIEQNELRYQLLSDLRGTQPVEAYQIIEALIITKEIAGDICEFGVAQGSTSILIANEIMKSEKMLHLFDSFEGLPNPTEYDELKDDVLNLGNISAYKGTMSFSEELVTSKLNSIKFPAERYKIHKGFIENIIKNKNDLPSKVSFAYIDFDFYEPIKVALEYIDSVSSKGTIIVVDDYDYFSTGAKKAVDEFMAKANVDKNKYEIRIPDKRIGHFALIIRLL